MWNIFTSGVGMKGVVKDADDLEVPKSRNWATLVIRVNKCSERARKNIEAAGGQVELV